MPDPTAMEPLLSVMCHLIDGDADSAARIFPRDETAMESLFVLLRNNQLRGYFHLLIKDSPLEDLLPAAASAELEKAYRTQAERAQRHLDLLNELQQCLGKNAIPFIALKGLYISHRFFGDIRNRFMWDLDVLVHPHHLHPTLDLVQDMGLGPTSDLPVDVTNSRWGIHAVEVAGARGKIDIHIALRSLPGIYIDLDRQWRNARQYEIEGVPLTCASDQDTLFLCCLGLGTDIRRGRFNLRKIWDVYLMLRQMDGPTDWQVFLEQRAQEGALRLTINTLAFVIFLVGCADQYPSAVDALQHHSRQLLIANRTDALALYARGQSTLHNHFLFSRLLPVPAWQYWCQWLVTAPARRLYYWGTAPKRKA